MVFLKNSSNLSDVWSYGIIVPAIQDQPCNKLGQIRDLFTYPWRSKRLLGLASKSLHPQIVQLIQKPTQKLKPMQHLVKELAEDIQERWETSDSPVVHKIQDLNDKVFGESATALSFKEIRRRDPSLSWSDFVAERCLAEHKAYERQGTFFENKAARQIQHHQQQHMMGSGGGGGGQFNDTTFTKIFVGGLGWETQRDTMRKYFEEFGEILEAVVITDKATGRSKGYGFVTFKDAEAAVRACQNPAPVIDGRKANCNLASLGAHKNRPPPPPSYPQGLFIYI